MAGASPGTAKGRSVARRADRGSHRSAVAPLERRVREVVAAERATVARRALGVRKLPPADVSPVRVDHARRWAFGTSAIAPPGATSPPDASLFLARRGQSRTLETAGGGLRFGGGDGRVLAPGAGRLYRLCAKGPSRGMLLLIHPSGLASEFYGMTRLTAAGQGAAVRPGSYLGRTGTDRPCGGPPAAGPAAVSFALAGARSPVPLDGARIGGWTLHVAAGAVSADRPGVHVDAGNPLLNFGAETPVSHPPAESPSPAPARPTGAPHQEFPVVDSGGVR